ncbi:UPF0158 family protein [Paeniglutamicibacter gangotriensis]|uniref:UPF0158 family protein n=1 Tax=Paeniglutamicibacter gangotriensis TaxID=254787 RepID=UPI0037CB04C1
MLNLEDFDLEQIADAMQQGDSMGLGYYLNIVSGEIVVNGFDDEECNPDPEELADKKYVFIERVESYESYQHMEDFTLSLPAGKARAGLEQALVRSKPFRHFKDVLDNYQEERKAWFGFRDEAMRRVVIRWLASIEAIEDPDPNGTSESQPEL